MRTDGGPCSVAHVREGDGPQAHQQASPLHAQRSIQPTTTHGGNAQAR